jgi:hypothetical protein
LHTWYWPNNFGWWFNNGSTPSEVSQTAAREALQDATGNIPQVFNVSAHGDFVSATQSFKGDTTTSVDISSAGVCLTPDDKNVAGFGTLPSNIIGGTCVWGDGVPNPFGIADRSDLRLNKADYQWVGNIGPNCTDKMSIRAIATHERGHTFGIAHVDADLHPNLTMRDEALDAFTCSNAMASLGKGDWLGLEALY